MHISFSSEWPTWLVWIAALMLLGFTALSYRQVRDAKVSRKVFWTIVALRVAAILALLLLLLQPLVRSTRQITQKAIVPVLLDASESMSIEDEAGGKRRIDNAVALLQGDASLVAALGTKFDARLFQFGSGLLPIDRRKFSLEALTLDDETNLGKSLQEILNSLRGQPVSAVVVLTDGQETGDIDAAAVAGGFQVPVHCVAFGAKAKDSPPDLFVKRVTANEQAIINNLVPVEIVIGGVGIKKDFVKVNLSLGEQVVQSQNVVLDPAAGEAKLQMSFRPTLKGTFFYTVEVPARADELVKENNKQNFKLTVIDRKIQVLLVDGHVRFEYKFLKRALEADPNVNVFSLLKSSEEKLYAQGTPPPGVVLTGFPSNVEQMKSFDVIMIGDIGRRYFTSSQLGALVQYVSNGGALIMLGGYEALGAGGYGSSPLEKVLPVELPNVRAAQLEEPFQIELTEEGANHPVFSLGRDSRATRDAWRRFGSLDGLTIVGAPKPGAMVLAVDPLRKATWGHLIVVAAQPYGRGKSMVVTSDTTWRWAFGATSQSQEMHRRFWSQSMRWLLPPQKSDEDKSRGVTVTTDRDKYDYGQSVHVLAICVEKGGTFVNDAVVHTKIETPGGKSIEVALKKVDGKEGQYAGSFTPRDRGIHKLVVTATAKGAKLGEDTTSIDVTRSSQEFERVHRNEELLAEIACRSAGNLYESADAGNIPKNLRDVSRKVTQKVEFRLMDNPAALAVLLAVLSAEWIVRRKNNFK